MIHERDDGDIYIIIIVFSCFIWKDRGQGLERRGKSARRIGEIEINDHVNGEVVQSVVRIFFLYV